MTHPDDLAAGSRPTASGGDADAPRTPARFNFAADVLRRRATETPEAVAMLAVGRDGSERPWTYGEVDRASGRLTAAMLQAGLVKGDRVLLFVPRVPLWQVAMAACLHAGIIPVPCMTQLSAAELAYRTRRSGARGAITASGLLDRFSGIEENLDFRAAIGGGPRWQDLDAIIQRPVEAPPFADMPGDAPALMYFTSGSSGMPKAVVHAARGVFVRGWQPWRQLGLAPGDLVWTSSDTGWTRAGSCLLFGPWTHGATALIVDVPPAAQDRLALLDRYGVSIFAAVASELRQIMAQSESRRLPRLRWTLSAGEVMTAELAERWHAFCGVPLVVGYGQTETPTATLTDPSRKVVNGAIGHPMAGNRVTVVDEAGRETAPLVEGDIVFARSDPGLLLGYWVEEGIVAAPSVGDWHLSGDRGFRDEDGELHFVGRSDDIISSSGYRIGPTEVENALASHPAVAECAVVASPDPMRGEVVKAYVVPAPGCQADASLAVVLQEHVKRMVAPYKYPRRLEFVATLPRTASGKVSRRLLRDKEFAGP
jgi:acyl-coenzyme A synthetase/AMP-(fatty) acid ligase